MTSYDIMPILPADATQDQVPAMLQKLAERFHLAARTETRPRNGYVLVVRRGGPKLQTAKPADGMGFRVSSDCIQFTNTTLSDIASVLASFTGRPVSDQTGVEGKYDVTLYASMSDLRSLSSGGDSQAGSIFGALRDIGLNLEPHTAPAKFVIVDKIDKIPTSN